MLARMRNTDTSKKPLRAARDRAGLTQLQLAVKAGCSIQTISLGERTGFLSAGSAARLAAALGVPVEELRS